MRTHVLFKELIYGSIKEPDGAAALRRDAGDGEAAPCRLITATDRCVRARSATAVMEPVEQAWHAEGASATKVVDLPSCEPLIPFLLVVDPTCRAFPLMPVHDCWPLRMQPVRL